MIAQDDLPDVDRESGTAFGFRGGDSWPCTTPDVQTATRYDPATETAITTATTPRPSSAPASPPARRTYAAPPACFCGRLTRIVRPVSLR